MPVEPQLSFTTQQYYEYMKEIQKEDLLLLSRHSNISPKGLQKALESVVYKNKASWKRFISYGLMALGIGFAVTGIVFFFAYNWAGLSKFTKLGIVQGLLILSTLVAVYPKLSKQLRDIILTGAAVLVGVIFAVFGQIYQTGANAYDFFLAWTFFISIWVLSSKFAPLTLLYVVLMHTTLILYSQQVAKDWSFVLICTLLFILNISITLLIGLLKKYSAAWPTATWFSKIINLTGISFATAGIAIGIHDGSTAVYWLLLVLYLAFIVVGTIRAIANHDSFQIAISALSIICIICSLLFLIDEDMIFLLVSVFIVVAVTLAVKGLLYLQKKWRTNG